MLDDLKFTIPAEKFMISKSLQNYIDKGFVTVNVCNVTINTSTSDAWLEDDAFYFELFSGLGYPDGVTIRLKGDKKDLVHDILENRIVRNVLQRYADLGRATPFLYLENLREISAEWTIELNDQSNNRGIDAQEELTILGSQIDALIENYNEPIDQNIDPELIKLADQAITNSQPKITKKRKQEK